MPTTLTSTTRRASAQSSDPGVGEQQVDAAPADLGRQLLYTGLGAEIGKYGRAKANLAEMEMARRAGDLLEREAVCGRRRAAAWRRHAVPPGSSSAREPSGGEAVSIFNVICTPERAIIAADTAFSAGFAEGAPRIAGRASKFWIVPHLRAILTGRGPQTIFARAFDQTSPRAPGSSAALPGMPTRSRSPATSRRCARRA